MLKSLSRLNFFCILFLLSSSILFAAPEVKRPEIKNQDWRLLKQAQAAFEENDFGLAASLAVSAKDSRAKECKWKIYTLDNLLKTREARSATSNIKDVLLALEKRDSKVGIEIIYDELTKHGSSYFNDDIGQLQEHVAKQNEYPEADFLLSKIYALEGESAQAISFAKKAYDNAWLLNVSEEKYDILYSLAFLSKDSGNTDDYEAYLLTILKDNKHFVDESFLQSLCRIIKKDSKKEVDKYFLMFRSENDFSLKALNELCHYYRNNGKDDKALNCAALGVTTAFTKIYNVIKSREVQFEYQGLKELLRHAKKYQDIINWGNEEKVWELFLLFADCSSSSGSLKFAHELYEILSVAEPEDYWCKVAAERIKI